MTRDEGPRAAGERDAEGGLERLEHAAEDAYWIARITSEATRRVARDSLWAGARTGSRLLRAASRSRSLEEFVDRYEAIAFEEFDRLAGDGGTGRRAADGGGAKASHSESRRSRRARGRPAARGGAETAEDLLERGEDLLERSADVDDEELVHPGFSRILDELAPDEARLLRYLAENGPQPSVDVRDKGWLPVSSDVVTAGRTMVGTEAGLRREDWIQVYLGNLERLGLLWFADEPVREVKEYQLLEAQPVVKEAIDGCRRPSVTRRSIHLTPFGVQFCRTCLPVDDVVEDAAGIYDEPGRRGSGGPGAGGDVELR